MHRKLGKSHRDFMSIRQERAQSRQPNENKGPEEAISVPQSHYATENTPVTKNGRSAKFSDKLHVQAKVSTRRIRLSFARKARRECSSLTL